MWLALGQTLSQPPAIFRVIGFVAADGRFLWPGFGDNARVLSWIVERAHGRATALETACGWMPGYDDLNLSGLELTRASGRAAACRGA